MDKTYSQEELAQFGFEVLEARRKGGRTVYKMYGKEHFSKLAKLSNKKREDNKLLRRTII